MTRGAKGATIGVSNSEL